MLTQQKIMVYNSQTDKLKRVTKGRQLQYLGFVQGNRRIIVVDSEIVLTFS